MAPDGRYKGVVRMDGRGVQVGFGNGEDQGRGLGHVQQSAGGLFDVMGYLVFYVARTC